MNRTALSATIDSTDDFSNSYTYDALNRLIRIDQIGVGGGNEVAEKRIDFSYNDDSRYDSFGTECDHLAEASCSRPLIEKHW